jgi:hypothetical protein
LPVSPGIETTSGDGQQSAHYPDVKFLAVFFDKHESYRLSGAKPVLSGAEVMATTFFRISRSCRNMAFSRSNSRIRFDSSAADLEPFVRLLPSFWFLRHLDNKPGVMPNSRSTAAADLPLDSKNAMASNLNSSG